MHLPSGAVFSILDHLIAMKLRVSSNFLAENHSICSAAGAIYVFDTFAQFHGTLTIENSSAEQHGGAVYTLKRLRESFEMLLELAWGCGRIISVVVSGLRTSCLMALHPVDGFACSEILCTNLLEKRLQTIRSLHWRTGVALMPRIVTSNSLAKWSSVSMYFPFWIISMLWKWGFPQSLWQKATAFARRQEQFMCMTPSPSPMAHWPSRIRRPSSMEVRYTFRDVAWAGLRLC